MISVQPPNVKPKQLVLWVPLVTKKKGRRTRAFLRLEKKVGGAAALGGLLY